MSQNLITAIEDIAAKLDWQSGCRGGAVPRDFGIAIQGIPQNREPLNRDLDCVHIVVVCTFYFECAFFCGKVACYHGNRPRQVLQ